MPEPRRERGLLDTAVVIALPYTDRSQLPAEMSLSAIAMAELVTGAHATDDVEERARRQDRLQRAQRTLDAGPFDGDAAQAYGRVCAAVTARGRKARGRRVMDLLIAATALAQGIPLFTCNPDDFEGLESLIDVVPVDPE